MYLLLLSFVAGAITILAPCVLPILPVLIGGSVADGDKSRPQVIIISFAISVIAFTLLLQYIIQIFDIRPDLLSTISAWILLGFGLMLLFPQWWQKLMHLSGIDSLTSKAQHSVSGSGYSKDIILGVVLGPIFNTCSPTYAILIATILPASFVWGMTNILVYVLGLCTMLSIIIYGGRSIITKLKRASHPNGWFKKLIAIILILASVAMIMKRDKQAEVWLIDRGLTIDTTDREVSQIQQFR